MALLLVLIGGPIAIVLLLSYATRARRNSLLGAHGRSAYGHIAELGSESNDMGSTYYWAKVQYDNDGVFTTSKVAISRSDNDRYLAGQRVLLTYVPGRPSVVKLDS